MEIKINEIYKYLEPTERDDIKSDLKEIEKKYGYKKNLVSVFKPFKKGDRYVIAVYGFLKDNAVIRFFDNFDEADDAWFKLQDYQEKMFKE